MATRPYILKETPWQTVRSTSYSTAILPWGATEAHNLHLPYGTDIYEAETMAAEAARLAWQQGARPVVLPGIPFGVNTGQLDIPLTINMNPSTQLAVLRDVADSLLGHGLHKLVLLNGHGGNDFKPAIRELQRTHDLLVLLVDWWQIETARDLLDEPGDHAGALETAVMMHIEPELVLPLAEAGAGAVRQPRLSALRAGWAWTPRRWTQLTRDTGVGDPAGATAAIGRQYFERVTQRLAELLVELHALPHGQLYGESTPRDDV